MGSEGKRKMRLKRKTNAELFSLYEDILSLRHSSQDALEEAKRVLGHFLNFLDGSPPSPELAYSYLARFTKHQPTTLYRYASIVKTFMGWYGEKLDIKIRLPERLPNYVEQDDIDKLKEAMKNKKTHKKVVERNLLIIELGLKAGLRRSDISNLMVKDIDLNRNYLVVRHGKGMKDRIIDLTPTLHEMLERYMKGKAPEERLVNLAPSTISGIITWAAKKAGVDIHTHSLRHFFGQSLIDTGTDIETARRLMGHASIKTTQVYLGRTSKQRKEAIDRLERPVSKEPTEGIIFPVETPGLSTTSSGQKEQSTVLNSFEKQDDIYRVVKELKAFTTNLGGTKFNAILVIQKLWGKFELGMSRTDVVEALTKCFPSENPGVEYFDVTDSLLEELNLLQIIRSEQRRMANVRSQWDTTFLVLTDGGKRVVRYLRADDHSIP
ncbi:tyrosine-type recombinase/integrase [Chloroflexota bacterium]